MPQTSGNVTAGQDIAISHHNTIVADLAELYANKPDYSEGSFTGTLGGVNSSVTGTFKYTKVGKSVTLALLGGGNLLGTSNGTLCYISGIPAGITPTNIQAGQLLVRNNGAWVQGQWSIGVTAYLNFYLFPYAAFTNIGEKGIGAFTISYVLF